MFNVDVENDYIYVADHQVNLTKEDGTEIIISEDKPFSLETFSFISLTNFIQNVRDTAWQDINRTFDQNYVLDLKDALEDNFRANNPLTVFLEIFSTKHKILKELETGQSFEKIDTWSAKLSEKKRLDTYNEVLSRYQSINFIDPSDTDFYGKKTMYKKTLILLSQDTEEKEMLLRSTLLDLEDMIKSKNLDNIGGTLSIITENKDLLKNIDIKSIISTQDLIPESLKNML